VEIGDAQGITTALDENGAIVLARGRESITQGRGSEIGLAGSEGQAGFIESNVGLLVGIALRYREGQGYGSATTIGDLEALVGGQGTRRFENAERDGGGVHGDAGGERRTG